MSHSLIEQEIEEFEKKIDDDITGLVFSYMDAVNRKTSQFGNYENNKQNLKLLLRQSLLRFARKVVEASVGEDGGGIIKRL